MNRPYEVEVRTQANENSPALYYSADAGSSIRQVKNNYFRMKRILLAFFLLTATCTLSYTQHATAQTTPPHVTLTDFTAKINLMDSYIAASNMTAAQSTWTEVHTMLMNILAYSKYSIRSATTTADRDSHMAILQNQQTIYLAISGLKGDLALNRTAIHGKLAEFGATIY